MVQTKTKCRIKKCTEALNSKNNTRTYKKKEGRHDEEHPILLACTNCFSCRFAWSSGFRNWNQITNCLSTIEKIKRKETSLFCLLVFIELTNKK